MEKNNGILAQRLVYALYERNLKIATAESCTGGGVGKEITEISGSSNVYECGIIAYANCVKTALLGVPEDILAKYGAVSEQTATAMAAGVKILANADIGVSSTGVAGPTGGTEEKPVGRVHIAAVSDGCVLHKQLSLLEECGNDRNAIRNATVREVLTLALQLIER